MKKPYDDFKVHTITYLSAMLHEYIRCTLKLCVQFELRKPNERNDEKI